MTKQIIKAANSGERRLSSQGINFIFGTGFKTTSLHLLYLF
jgi:hypothetical protein